MSEGSLCLPRGQWGTRRAGDRDSLLHPPVVIVSEDLRGQSGRLDDPGGVSVCCWNDYGDWQPRVTPVRDLTTWTILQNDDPNHLGMRCTALPETQMALIISVCVPSRERVSSRPAGSGHAL